MKKYDLLVIGGGSGGMACSKRAASYGKKVALFESKRLGGTCVNVGCVPKKVMYNTAEVAASLKISREYGFSFNKHQFDYTVLKKKRDALIERLNGIYMKKLTELTVDVVSHHASFVSDKVVESNGIQYTAPTIVIAGGGEPSSLKVPGIEHAINSDDFFNKVDKLPKKCAVIGGGYIAVELAGVLTQLGTETYIIFRKEKVLNGFDEMLRDVLMEELERSGINILAEKNVTKNEKKGELMDLTLDDGSTIKGLDLVIQAVGRNPVTIKKENKFDKTTHKLDDKGYVETDEWEETNVKGNYALGDINGKVPLTPVAIAAGRRLADRIFNGQVGRKLSYENIPSVVFSHPPIGTIGMTEKEAKRVYGEDKIKVYRSRFVNLFYTVSNNKPRTSYKLVCLGEEEKVIGIHIIGMGSDEILQGFGVAMKMGATKKDFDSCVAIHPTASEELVTMV